VPLALIPFVQLEFAGELGLPEGRYLSRDDEGDRVLVVQAFGAPRPTSRLARRTKPVDPDEAELIPLTRVTVAFPDRFSKKNEAESWLDETAGSAEARGAVVRSATLLVNRALNALRAGARDPLVQDVGATRALAIRIGFGDGDQLADGRWEEARELARPRSGRLDDIDPQERVAAVLSGRESVHPAETLLERARLDIQQQRFAEARLGLRAARTAVEEDPPEDGAGKLSERIAEAEARLAGGA
jgi:hypothetical protein